MTEIRILKLRLYPKREQERLLSEQLECCRLLSNACIEERTRAYKEQRVSITRRRQQLQLPEIRRAFPEFNNCSAQVLQDVVRRVDQTFKNFFRVDGCGYPKYKGRAKYNSMTYPQQSKSTKSGTPGTFSYDGTVLKLSKIGTIRFLSRHKPSWHDKAKPKTCTVKREGDKWFAYITFEIELKPKQRPIFESPVGIDLGITSVVAMSNGNLVENPKFLEQNEKKLKRLHRRVSRKTKGSKNRRKAVLKLNNAYQHLRNQRHDFTHKLSRTIARNHSLVAVEDDLSGLSRGMLAKQVNDAAWGMIKRQLAYKCPEEGGILVLVDKNRTSQECSGCGRVVPKQLKDRIHSCSCGLVLDRDVNAARNVLKRALNQLPTDGGKVTLGETKSLPTEMSACIVVEPRSIEKLSVTSSRSFKKQRV